MKPDPDWTIDTPVIPSICWGIWFGVLVLMFVVLVQSSREFAEAPIGHLILENIAT